MKLPSTSHIPSISHLLCNFVTQSSAVLCHARLRRELLSHRVQAFHQAWESCDMGLRLVTAPFHGPKMSQTCPKSVPSMCVCSSCFILVYHSFIPIKNRSYASNFVHLKPIRTGIAHPLDLSAVTAGILQYGPMDVGKRPKHIIFHEAVKSLCYSYPAWKEWSLHLVSGSEHVRSQKRITESTGDSATINESGLITGQFNSRLSWVAQRSKFLPTVVERCWT